MAAWKLAGAVRCAKMYSRQTASAGSKKARTINYVTGSQLNNHESSQKVFALQKVEKVVLQRSCTRSINWKLFIVKLSRPSLFEGVRAFLLPAEPQRLPHRLGLRFLVLQISRHQYISVPLEAACFKVNGFEDRCIMPAQVCEFRMTPPVLT